MKNLRGSVLLVALLMSSLPSTGCAELPTSLEDGGRDGSGGSNNVGAGTPDGGGGAAVGQGGEVSSGGENQGGEAPQPASFELSIMGEPPTIELRSSVELTVSVAANGYVGAVALEVGGLPEDITAELMSASVTLQGSGAEAVAVRLSSLSSTVTGTFPFTVTGTVEGGAKSAGNSITVAPMITIIIPPDLAGYSGQTDAFGDYPTLIRALPDMSEANPITVRFLNTDTVGHEIHSDAGNGFVHGNQSIPPGELDPVVRMVNAPGEYDYYPHDLDPSIPGQILIE